MKKLRVILISLIMLSSFNLCGCAEQYVATVDNQHDNAAAAANALTLKSIKTSFETEISQMDLYGAALGKCNIIVDSTEQGVELSFVVLQQNGKYTDGTIYDLSSFKSNMAVRLHGLAAGKYSVEISYLNGRPVVANVEAVEAQA